MASNYVEFGAKLKVTEDVSQQQIMFGKNISLTKTAITDLMCEDGQMDLGATETDVELPMGDIATGHFLWMESDVSGFSFKISGSGNTAIPLEPRISGQHAFAVLMTTFTSVHVTSGSNAGRLTYCICGLGA